jgi:hypothetical protein
MRYDYRFRAGLFIAILLFFTAGCSRGGGGGVVATPENANVGVFLDSAVDGMDYSTGSWSGTTGDAGTQGSFYYQNGESITFSIGSVILGTTAAKGLITPADLGASVKTTADQKVINIARLILSLDSDNNPDNGITISEQAREALTGVNVDLTNPTLDNDAGIQEMFRRLNEIGVFQVYPEEVTSLVSSEDAQIHLENTLTQIQVEAEEEQEALLNLKLTAYIASPEGNVIMVQGQSLSLQGTVYGGRTPYTYSWNFEGEAPFSTVKNPGAKIFNSTGSYVLHFTATDGTGDTRTDSRLITVLGRETQAGSFEQDSAPTVTITHPLNDTSVKAGETVTFTATLYNGDVPLIYNWSLGSVPGNTFVPGSAQVTYLSPRTYAIFQGMTLTSPGSYYIFISVRDTNTGGRYPDTHASFVRITVN